MKSLALAPQLLLAALLLGSCSDGESREVSAAPGGPGEDSVLAAYDPALHDASLDAIRAGDSGSTLDFEVDNIDLGDCVQQEKYPVEFPFEVQGQSAVSITSLSPSCGCTNARLEVEGDPWALGKPIPAGSKGKVIAVFNTLSVRGVKRSNISVLSNATNRRAVLRLEAHIHPIFELNPYQARFGNITHGETADFKVEVRGIEDWEIVEWEEFPPGISAEEIGEPWQPNEGTGMTRTILISVLPAAQIGMVYGSVKAITSLGKTLEIPVNGAVLGRVRFLPEHRVTFGLVKAGADPQHRKVRIIPTKPGMVIPEPTVELANNDAGYFSVELRPNDGRTAYDVILYLSPETPIGRHDATLKVTMPGDLEEESRDLSVIAIVRQL